MKRGGIMVIIFLGLLVLLIVPLISAGFFDDFVKRFTGEERITGELTSNETSLNITIGNAAPTITFVEAISAQSPVEAGNRTITFNFTATDDDGGGNINVSTAEGRFQLSGEPTRLNLTCSDWATSGNDVNFTCTIDMTYFDKNDASWTINVTVRDNNQATGENSSTTFQYNVLTAMVMSPVSLGWPAVSLSGTNTGSNTDPITINNTGNDINLNINVTGLDLQGEETSSEHIFTENFTIENISEGCGAGATAMVNDSSINVTSLILQRGDNDLGNGQEEVFFCLKGVPQDISAQSYSSTALGSWTVIIN